MKVDILAIGAHPDDVELSCSGTILAQGALGKTTAVVDLTLGELGTRGTVETRKEEAAIASKILGLKARENLELADGFYQNDKESQLKLIAAIRRYQPDIVLANAIFDRHPDHGKGARLAYDSFFMAGLRKIETFEADGTPQATWRPRLLLHYIQDRWIKPDIVMDISGFWEQKMESIKAYGTQFYDPKNKSNEPQTYISSMKFLDSLEARAREMARPCGFEYGEGFTANDKFLGVKDLFGIF